MGSLRSSSAGSSLSIWRHRRHAAGAMPRLTAFCRADFKADGWPRHTPSAATCTLLRIPVFCQVTDPPWQGGTFVCKRRWQGAPAAAGPPPLLVLLSLLLGDEAVAAPEALLPFSLTTMVADQQGTERGLEPGRAGLGTW